MWESGCKSYFKSLCLSLCICEMGVMSELPLRVVVRINKSSLGDSLEEGLAYCKTLPLQVLTLFSKPPPPAGDMASGQLCSKRRERAVPPLPSQGGPTVMWPL